MELLFSSFQKIVTKQPLQIAIKDGDRDITYEDLSKHVTIVAGWLIGQGAKKGDRIGIHLPNSIDYIVAYYACWKAELVPVALNTFASPHEIVNWVSNSESILLFSRKLKQNIEKVPVFSLSTEAGFVEINGQNISSGNVDVFPDSILEDDVATIIYTSGTTGNPKGITLSHKNLSTNIHAIINSLSITDNDVFLCVLPFFYSFGNSILHTHLVSGATLIILNQVMYPNEILKHIEKEKCTGFAGVPTIYISLLKKTSFNDFDLSSLRYMTQAGGPLSKTFIDQIAQKLPDVKFIIMYGQTEASARISYLPYQHLHEKLGSVGIGVDGVTITIEDANGKICAPGDHGEICIQGENVMQGYWHNPEATAQVLINRKLHTGDMGYKDSDGFLYIVGRQTEILKISEHRVSPYEIEEVLLGHASVEECAVIGCNHSQSGQYVKAFVVKNSSEITENQIKKFSKQFLASYKIPKKVVFVNSLPKTSSGKIKRTLLSC